jgi:hypothetical protein
VCRGSFVSVRGLKHAIATFIEGCNDSCHPFTWTQAADQILPTPSAGKTQSRGTIPPPV